MSLALALLLAAAIWILVLVFVLALGSAAKAGDHVMEHRLSEAAGHEVFHSWWDDHCVANRRRIDEDPEAPSRRSLQPTTAGSVTPLRALPLDAAAELLGIGPLTLLAWEQEYGYPQSIGGDASGPRYYSRIEVIVLKDALGTTLSIGAAIRTARSIVGGRHGAPSDAVQFSSHRDVPPGS